MRAASLALLMMTAESMLSKRPVSKSSGCYTEAWRDPSPQLSRWQHCIRFGRPKNWTPDLLLRQRRRYRFAKVHVIAVSDVISSEHCPFLTPNSCEAKLENDIGHCLQWHLASPKKQLVPQWVIFCIGSVENTGPVFYCQNAAAPDYLFVSLHDVGVTLVWCHQLYLET